jgi:hypothetical protein
VQPRRFATGRLVADEQPDPETSVDYHDAVKARLDRIVLETRQGLMTAADGMMSRKEPRDGR